MIELGEQKKWWFVNDDFEVVQGAGQHQSGVDTGWYFREPGAPSRGRRRDESELHETSVAAANAASEKLQAHIAELQGKLKKIAMSLVDAMGR